MHSSRMGQVDTTGVLENISLGKRLISSLGEAFSSTFCSEKRVQTVKKNRVNAIQVKQIK